MRDNHYDMEAWVDFVRGLSSQSEYSAMQTHLASGCLACSETVSLMTRVWKAGRLLADDRVPEDWSRKAEDVLRNESMVSIRLLPVRRAMPAVGGIGALEGIAVRAEAGSGRNTVYETEGCLVTLNLDQRRDSRELSIIGQITDRRRIDWAAASIPIFLLHGKKLVASTSSNEFGEFRLACELNSKMVISFPFDGYRIDVMLDDSVPTEETYYS